MPAARLASRSPRAPPLSEDAERGGARGGSGNTVEGGARLTGSATLVALDPLPLPERILGVGHRLVAEDVRVAPGHLLDEAIEHVRHGELAGLSRHLAVEHDLEEQVAQLLGEVPRIVLIDGLQDLVGLLDQVGLEGGAGLLAVPWAASLAAQPGHERQERIESDTGGISHERSRGRERIIHKGARALKAFHARATLRRQPEGMRWRKRRASRSSIDVGASRMASRRGPVPARRRPCRPRPAGRPSTRGVPAKSPDARSQSRPPLPRGRSTFRGCSSCSRARP